MSHKNVSSKCLNKMSDVPDQKPLLFNPYATGGGPNFNIKFAKC